MMLKIVQKKTTTIKVSVYLEMKVQIIMEFTIHMMKRLQTPCGNAEYLHIHRNMISIICILIIVNYCAA